MDLHGNTMGEKGGHTATVFITETSLRELTQPFVPCLFNRPDNIIDLSHHKETYLTFAEAILKDFHAFDVPDEPFIRIRNPVIKKAP